MFQLQDTSSVDVEFVPQFEEQIDNANLSQAAVFLEPHDYELFLLSQEIDTPSDNLSHLESHTCENSCQDDPSCTHATNLGLIFTLPHFIA